MTTTSPREPPHTYRPEVRIEAAGSSPDEAIATLPGMYGGKHWYSAPTDGPYTYRYLAVGDTALTLRRSQLRGFLRGEVHIGGDYVVHWLTSGTVVLDTHGDPIPLPPMRPNLSPDGKEFVFEAADYDARLVHLNRDLVHDVASERAGTALHALQLPPRPAADAAALERWRRALADATAIVGGRGDAPLAWHHATRSVADAFLALYPPQDPPAHPSLLYPKNFRIRAAVEYIHAHAASPLTVGQIAEAAGLSIRSVQEGFQRVLGMTPMSYLHHLRLERTHTDLLAADPDATTVSTVARRWGFLHLGRFSAHYRRRFGEYPSETIRRRG